MTAKRNKTNQIADIRWGDTEFSSGDTRFFRIADLLIAVAFKAGEIQISHCYVKDSEADPEQEFGADAQWNRWDVAGDAVTIRFAPQFAEIPYMVKAENPFELTPKATKKVYVKIPVWLACSIVSPVQQNLITVSVVKLSKTWFGDFADGEVCYWISSGARSRFEPLPENLYLAVCPLRLSNGSSELLKVEKICVRAQYLSIYMDEHILWANEMAIVFKGQNNFSDLRVRAKAPKEAPDAQLLSGPQIVDRKKFRIKTFGGLLDLSPFDFFSK